MENVWNHLTHLQNYNVPKLQICLSYSLNAFVGAD